MAVAIAHNVGSEILKAMGIDETEVRGFELRCYVDEIVVITIEKYVTETQIEGLKTVLKKFELHEIKEPKEGIRLDLHPGDGHENLFEDPE